MKYSITYSAAGLTPIERPLTSGRIEHHALCLENDLRRDMSLQRFEMKFRTILDGAKSRVEVEVGENLDSDAISGALAKAVQYINQRTSGLCFIIS